jgi:hypothetical protein
MPTSSGKIQGWKKIYGSNDGSDTYLSCGNTRDAYIALLGLILESKYQEGGQDGMLKYFMKMDIQRRGREMDRG